MTPEDLAQIRTLKHIHTIKLQRMEVELNKEKRALKKEEGTLDSIKKRIQELQDTLISEQKQWEERVEKNPQKKNTLLEMKHALNALRGSITKKEDEKKDQQEVVAKKKEQIKKTKENIVKQNVKLEKFTFIVEDE